MVHNLSQGTYDRVHLVVYNDIPGFSSRTLSVTRVFIFSWFFLWLPIISNFSYILFLHNYPKTQWLKTTTFYLLTVLWDRILDRGFWHWLSSALQHIGPPGVAQVTGGGLHWFHWGHMPGSSVFAIAWTLHFFNHVYSSYGQLGHVHSVIKVVGLLTWQLALPEVQKCKVHKQNSLGFPKASAKNWHNVIPAAFYWLKYISGPAQIYRGDYIRRRVLRGWLVGW